MRGTLAAAVTRSDPRLHAALDRFDALNAQDPNTELVEGRPQPKELVYARRMTDWLQRLDPAASVPLQLAARSQHLMRWHVPRETFPMDRAGYIRWRTTLYDFHADRAAEVLREVGHDDATIDRVRSLIRKQNLKTDADAQTLEDVICLVFLENYFAEFARDHDEEKLVRILRKTWKKMSPRGHDAALKLNLGARELELVSKALEA
jgi:hypothetical protein